MRRFHRLAPLAALCALLAAGAVHGQGKGPTLTVRAGFLPGPLQDKDDPFRRAPMSKVGQWTPVYVTVEGKAAIRDAVLTVQSIDGDDVLNDYSVKIPLMEFNSETPTHTVMAYTRPGKPDNPITAKLQFAGKEVSAETLPYALPQSYYVYLTLGARLPGMWLPGMKDRDKEDYRKSETAAIDKVQELPDKWYGYNAADLVVLTTGDPAFADGLLSDEAKRSALFEWVRRGGKLLISVGKSHGQLANREPLRAILPVELAGTLTPKSVRVDFQTLPVDELADPQGKNLIDLTKLETKPGRGARELATYSEGSKRGPLVVQGPYGLGRVTVVAVDLDQPPFTRWKDQGKFWERLLSESGPVYMAAQPDGNTGFQAADGSDAELLGRMLHGLESFDGVPVISFGWVALFILIYIVVVGPLDYFFLKKVVKRLELTWVTFPLVVLAVSAAAYFTAYALKGDDQKINKLDLIDIDMQTDTVQGTSWFVIFSPRIQNFTVGVEPGDGWGVKAGSTSPPLVSWCSRDTQSRKTLFRRSYEYDTETGGLVRVPIQVWSTKGFQATWAGRLDPAQPPVRSDLFNTPGGLGGSVTSFLPVNLEEAVILHRGKTYKLETLIPGEANRKQMIGSNESVLTWARPAGGVSPPTGGYQGYRPEPARDFMRDLMFHEASHSSDQKRVSRNGGLREYDESWRVAGTDEKDPGDFAVLVGKIAVPSRPVPANEANAAPGTPTKLWLGALPDGGAKRPEVQGVMRQETYVRVYLPVKSRK